MSFITNAIGSLFGTTQQADAATLAAQQQANSQQQGAAALTAQLAPYNQFGASAMPNLINKLGLGGTGGGFQYAPFSFNPSDLQNTPGYQFTLQQGQKGVNNALSSQGLLGSGAQSKALSDYITGLANNTYNQQLQNALGMYQTNYGTALGTYNTNAGQLGSLLNLGQNAAAGVGQANQNAAVNAGNAIAQGTIGSGSQTANTFNSLLNLGKAGSSIYSAYNTPTTPTKP